jgi:hypothetical protein
MNKRFTNPAQSLAVAVPPSPKHHRQALWDVGKIPADVHQVKNGRILSTTGGNAL